MTLKPAAVKTVTGRPVASHTAPPSGAIRNEIE